MNQIEPKKKSMQRQQQDAAIKTILAGIKKKYIVMSGKGGVGKSSLAVNLAVYMAKQGKKIGLLDVDLHGPSVPNMLGLSGVLEIAPDRSILPQAWDENLRVVSIDSMLKDRQDAIIWRGPKKITAIRQFISDVSWGKLDVLLIDSPPGTGDEALTVAQLIPSVQAIVVTTPQEVSIADVRKSINFLKKLGVTPVGLVENMSGFKCPHCGETTYIFGREGGRLLAEAMEIDFLGTVPLDQEAVKAADQGRPYVLESPDSDFAKALAQIADKL